MKVLWRKIGWFVLITLSIYAAFFILAIKAADVFKDGAGIICQKKREFVRDKTFSQFPTKENIIVFGSSDILSGFNPLLFDSLNGDITYTYNLALPALTIGSSYFILKDYLKNNPPPDCILLNVRVDYGDSPGLFDYYALQGINMPSEFISFIRNRKDKSFIRNYFLPFNLYQNHLIKYTFHLIHKPSAIKQRSSVNLSNIAEMKRCRGYYYIKEQAMQQIPDEMIAQIKHIPSSDLDIFKDPYVKKFFDLTRKYKIKVLLIQAFTINKNEIIQTTCPDYYKTLKKLYPEIVDWDKEGMQAKLYDKKYFSDPAHLNKEGANLYTSEIFMEFHHYFTGSHSNKR